MDSRQHGVAEQVVTSAIRLFWSAGPGSDGMLADQDVPLPEAVLSGWLQEAGRLAT